MSDKKTCLYERHIAAGAGMVSFGGFEMPLQYSDITDEHLAVRNHCGMFDVSHMGEVLVSGHDAEKFVQFLFTNDIKEVPAGRICYGMMLNEQGGTIDDLLVYRMEDNRFFLVINAANIEKDYAWIERQSRAFDVKVENCSRYCGQLAIQGPEAEEIVELILGLACKDLVFYAFKTVDSENETIIVSRTGYTGEDGFEIYGSHGYICRTWDRVMASGRVKPCGLGCRDTLRFEVGLPLYGNELGETVSPLEAALGMFVKLDKTEDFIGKEALKKQKSTGLTRKIVGIELCSRAIPRHGYEVLSEEGETIGYVTTGYSSPSTGKSVCMAMIDIRFTALGTPVKILIHRKLHEGFVTKKRFFQKSYKK